MKRKQKRLGELLIRKGLLTPKQLEDALEEQRHTKEFLGAILVKRGIIKEKEFLETLSDQFQIPFKTISHTYIDWAFVTKFSPSLILDYKCFPLEVDDYAITMAITNPLDAWAIKKAEEGSRGFNLKLVLVSEEDMNEAIRRYKEYMRRKYQ